jgi:hypothetical protein
MPRTSPTATSSSILRGISRLFSSFVTRLDVYDGGNRVRIQL